MKKKKKKYKKTTAENILNREFKLDKFGEKWLTDVTEDTNIHQKHLVTN